MSLQRTKAPSLQRFDCGNWTVDDLCYVLQDQVVDQAKCNHFALIDRELTESLCDVVDADAVEGHRLG